MPMEERLMLQAAIAGDLWLGQTRLAYQAYAGHARLLAVMPDMLIASAVISYGVRNSGLPMSINRAVDATSLKRQTVSERIKAMVASNVLLRVDGDGPVTISPNFTRAVVTAEVINPIVELIATKNAELLRTLDQ
jgi:hypothetical protein